MNEKLKRVLAIVGLCAMGLFSVAFVMYLIDNTLFDGYIGIIAIVTFAIGGGIFLWIYFAKGFPAQQRKIEEMENLKAEYEKKQAENVAKMAENEVAQIEHNSENSENSGENCATDHKEKNEDEA